MSPKIIHIPRAVLQRSTPDPDPTPASIAQAQADTLQDRADLLEALPEPEQNALLDRMTYPSYLELQAMESRWVETIADDFAGLLYASPLDRLSPERQLTMRRNAAIFLRSRHRAWKQYALDQAIEALHLAIVADLAPAYPRISEGQWRAAAVRYAALVVATHDSALASEKGIAPGAYLRIVGKGMAEDAGGAA